MGRKKPRRRKDKQGFWPSWSGFRGKTVWDWLPILGTLAIPIMIAVGTWGITWQQGNLEDQRAQGDREVAEVSFEEGLTEERVSGETVRATLARMGVRWQRAKHWITSPDPLYARKKEGAMD